ncbi:uncharacterized protein [Triticum aestivum]|uniref:uncharacterized protein isoform X2 n=1 Tax=Triticum aestivum TaxID=4565 RepID=UPI001D0285A0|nr:uncharacterized protein LOC123112372 isoform X2 [Triticum aestivum]XP_044389275.1 uncharacterized protein LOC123112372 isoform X2 [Triticum aestivum]
MAACSPILAPPSSRTRKGRVRRSGKDHTHPPLELEVLEKLRCSKEAAPNRTIVFIFQVERSISTIMMPKLIRLVVCSPCSSLSSGEVDLDSSAASPTTRRTPYPRHLLFGCESVQESWVQLMPMSVAALDTALSLRVHIIFYNSAIFCQVFIILPSLVLICIV